MRRRHHGGCRVAVERAAHGCTLICDGHLRASGGWFNRKVKPVELLHEAYDPLIAFAAAVDEQVGWTATELPGWTVRDVLFHLATDGQRALVALASPSDRFCDTDDVTYWSAWQPGTDPAQSTLRGVRIAASAWTSVRGPAELFATTAQAVLAVAANTDLARSVATQGRTLTAEALLRTLVVEATVHHLDLQPALAAQPAAVALAEVRRVLDTLLGHAAPVGWDDIRYIRTGTGRQALDPAERQALGPLANRFPMFG